MNYGQLLKHPNWQKKRLEILQLNEYTCQHCGQTQQTLHVHHWAYKPGALPWEYHANELACLCEDCHTVEHMKLDPILSKVRRQIIVIKDVAALKIINQTILEAYGKRSGVPILS